MSVLDRRIAWAQARRTTPFDARQVHVESAIRGRIARKVRGHVRRMDPVALLTPRWSAPQPFLEDVALDLAVGSPGLGCRTVSLRPLRGRSEAEAWNFLLRVLSDLAGPARTLPTVADRRGFQYVARELIDDAHENNHGSALLAHGVEHLPVSVLEELVGLFGEYFSTAGDDRRVTALFAASVESPSLRLREMVDIELCDYAEPEAEASVLALAGPVQREALIRAVAFTGGVPAMVEAVARGASAHGNVPRDDGELLRLMGPLADDLRAAIGIALTNPESAERLHTLLDGEAHDEEPELDNALRLAGLVRRVRTSGGGARVALRAPALAALTLG